MDFKEQLNAYIALLGCSARELADQAGLSPATLSRYRSGDRLPDSGQLAALVQGMETIAAKRQVAGFSAKEAGETLAALCSGASILDAETLRSNFNTLLTVLSINVSELSRSTHYDASYISRIRSGQRKPADPQRFARDIASFAARRYREDGDRAIVAQLLGCTPEALTDESVYCRRLTQWLISSDASRPDYSFDFLKKLDDFDLGEYIRAIHFDAIKVPTVPFQLPTSKSYFGLTQMMESELDFLKTTVMGKSMESVILYSDMPMEEMVKDPDFPKQWMFGMAMMLKKGLHLHQIHNVDRTFHEMMLGLESWIPLYMTGQVSPYYLKGVQNNVFLHSLKVSGSAAHVGQAIAGFHTNGRYYLTKQKDEVAFYRTMANDLLKKASPLMDIYREDSLNKFNAFLLADAPVAGSRRAIRSAPPVYTMTEAYLADFLQARFVCGPDRERILAYWKVSRKYYEDILAHSPVQDDVPIFSREEFERFPPVLSLSGLFYEKNLPYTYEDYAEHLRLTQQFGQTHPNYTAHLTGSNAFRNIEVVMHEGDWVMVSKGKSPAIHFVIRHPKLRSAIENMVVPIVERE